LVGIVESSHEIILGPNSNFFQLIVRYFPRDREYCKI